MKNLRIFGVVLFAALFAATFATALHAHIMADRIEAFAKDRQPIEREVKSLAIELCWRMGQRAVLSPPGADRPSVQCEEAAL